ncbi:hypothetical protein ACJMK2_001308 [Sinanodonta woodiana]|uniref:Uncharacterized protein n=1 Tax=Sinanodonta woodiana TaxID=1069815 RepID=A0ABD3XU22_SINWO
MKYFFIFGCKNFDTEADSSTRYYSNPRTGGRSTDRSEWFKTVKPKLVRGAYHKRQNAEVLHQAMQSYNVNYVLDTPASARALVEVDDAELSIPFFVPIHQAQPQKIK